MKQALATTIASLGIVTVLGLGSYAADHIVIPYDWQIELQTTKLQHQFEYTGSHLHGVEKINATYKHAPTAAEPEPQSHAYESFWYHDGKPLGLERKHEFDLTQGDGVSIVIDHKDSDVSDRECKATANAILRVILDCYLNKNAVVNVRIPDESFDRVKQGLIDQGCMETPPGPDESGTTPTAINIYLQTEPDADRTHTLYYN